MERAPHLLDGRRLQDHFAHADPARQIQIVRIDITCCHDHRHVRPDPRRTLRAKSTPLAPGIDRSVSTRSNSAGRLRKSASASAARVTLRRDNRAGSASGWRAARSVPRRRGTARVRRCRETLPRPADVSRVTSPSTTGEVDVETGAFPHLARHSHSTVSGFSRCRARRRDQGLCSRPGGFVVKNGSKMRSSVSRVMPSPVSATVGRT